MNLSDIQKRADEFIEELDSKIEKSLAKDRKSELLENYQGEDRIVSWEDIAKEMASRPPKEKMKTGWTNLDHEIGGGFETSQLISISASTKSGKTSLCVDLTRRLKDYKPLWFALEESAEELIQKQINFNQPIPESYSPAILDNVSLEWIEDRILEGYIKYGTRVVIIDHLHFLANFVDSRERFDLQLTRIVSELKKMAKKLDVCIILVAHLKKVDLEKPPTVNDIKETSAVAQWSDKVLLIWREVERIAGKLTFTGLVNIQIGADRQTGSGANIPFLFEKGQFIEATSSDIKSSKEKINNLKNENDDEF